MLFCAKLCYAILHYATPNYITLSDMFNHGVTTNNRCLRFVLGGSGGWSVKQTALHYLLIILLHSDIQSFYYLRDNSVNLLNGKTEKHGTKYIFVKH